MKTCFLILLCACITPAAFAQTLLQSHSASGADVWGSAVDPAGNSAMSCKLSGAIDVDPSAASYIVSGTNAMAVARYDSSRNVTWACAWEAVDAGYLGSPSFPQIGSEECAMDAAGNVYVVGYFRGRVDFDPGSGVHEETALDINGSPCANTAFVLKLSAAGAFQWVRVWRGGVGTSGGVIGLGVTCLGNRVFVNGIFGPEIFLDPDNHTDQASSYSIATFVSVLTDTGGYLWGTGFASYVSLTTNLTPDPSGGVMFGLTYIVDIQIGHLPGSPQMTPTGNADTLVFHYDASGNLSWMRELSGAGANILGISSARDSAGNYYVAGQWRGTVDFDGGPGTYIESGTGTSLDAFIVKLDASGNFLWFRKMAGTGDENASSMVVAGPAVLLGGSFQGPVEFDSGPGSTVLGGGAGWVTRLDQGGNHVWSAEYPTVSTELAAEGSLLMVGGGDSWKWIDTAAPLSIYTPSIADAPMGIAASAQITAVAGSDAGYAWTLVSGSLPPGVGGLPVSATPTLLLTGTPTSTGTYNFRLRVQDSQGGAHERDFTWTITAPQPIAIAAGGIPASSVGSLASFTFSASGGAGTGYTWSLVSGGLPAGISGIPGSGTPSITASGTATTAGSYAMRVRVEDSVGGYDEVDFTWDITALPSLTIDSTPIVPATVGTSAVHTFMATGGTGSGYSWSVVSGNLPAGITGVPGLGTPVITVSGIPTSGGVASFRLRVEDSIGNSDEHDFTWDVVSMQVLAIQTAPVIPAVGVDTTVNFAFTASGGTGAGYSWSVVSGALPTGLAGIPGVGTPSVSVTGNAFAAGDYGFRVRVQDGAGNFDERDFTWTVNLQTSGPSAGGSGGGGGGGCAAGTGSSIALLALLALPLALRRRRQA